MRVLIPQGTGMKRPPPLPEPATRSITGSPARTPPTVVSVRIEVGSSSSLAGTLLHSKSLNEKLPRRIQRLESRLVKVNYSTKGAGGNTGSFFTRVG